MYGKHFAQMYSGSMFGKPAIVFAVWGYVIANMRPARRDDEDSDNFVELNPALLAATFATSVDDVHTALLILESPDPASRSKSDDGRRIVLLDSERGNGPMQYRVVNGAKYRKIRDEETRRAQNRDAQRRSRDRKKKQLTNADGQQCQPRSAQVEVEVEVEVEAEVETEAEVEAEAAEASFPSGKKRERDFPSARAREVSPKTEALLRHRAREITSNPHLMQMAIHETDDYAAEVRQLTGYSPEELAEITGDEDVLPHPELAAT